jgi:hypothetical protein
VRFFKEKHPTKKDVYTQRYLMLTLIPADYVTSGALLQDTTRLNKCDAVIHLFESGDRHKAKFV